MVNASWCVEPHQAWTSFLPACTLLSQREFKCMQKQHRPQLPGCQELWLHILLLHRLGREVNACSVNLLPTYMPASIPHPCSTQKSPDSCSRPRAEPGGCWQPWGAVSSPCSLREAGDGRALWDFKTPVLKVGCIPLVLPWTEVCVLAEGWLAIFLEWLRHPPLFNCCCTRGWSRQAAEWS